MHDFVDGDRGMVPWVAFVVFDLDKQRISDVGNLQTTKVSDFTAGRGFGKTEFEHDLPSRCKSPSTLIA